MNDPSAHHQGPYSEKYLHKKIQCENGRYITIGDPYKDKEKSLPPRFKHKQFQIEKNPANAGGGYFGLMGQPFTYVPDRYAEQLPYAKSQPLESRKLGFMTHDASKRDEFTHRIRTEQYRDLLKREKRLTQAIDGPRLEAAKEKLAQQDVEAAEARKAYGLDAPKFLYDVGKSRETPFDPKLARDRFYNERNARTREMRRGSYKTAAMDVGSGAWNAPPQMTLRGKSHATASFYTQGHIEVRDL